MNGDFAVGTEAHFSRSTEGRKVNKVSNYFDVYDRYLAPYKGKAPTILEIGVQHGGSLLLWNGFFEGEAKVVGIDILPECKQFEANNIRVFIGDQSDSAFLSAVIQQVGKVDIIIDDGSHIPRHQIASFQHLFYNGLADNGVYICEDCATSYWPRYGGGLRRRGTFIEFAKGLCDQVNAWSANVPELTVDDATKWIKSITFFGSVVVFEKAPMLPPHAVSAGQQGIDLEAQFKESRLAWLIMPLKRNAAVQRLVRRSPFLWNVMRRFLTPRK